MSKEQKIFRLTDEDKARYEKQIAEIDLAIKDKLITIIPAKLNLLLRSSKLSRFQINLIEDITKLYTILNNIPDLDESLQRRILFALQYFYESNDEIPDSVPDIGYLDDAVVVRWVVDQTIADYSQYFEA